MSRKAQHRLVSPIQQSDTNFKVKTFLIEQYNTLNNSLEINNMKLNFSYMVLKFLQKLDHVTGKHNTGWSLLYNRLILVLK